ncbi:MAG: galactokinase [Clostridia bacterium]|nr:galactokinase [Clostridia bacterium]
MASTNLKNFLEQNPSFPEVALRLYGEDVDVMAEAERYADLGQAHVEQFGKEHYRYFSSPGRIELVGNHTDHQHGKVLCASIDLDTLAAVTKTDDNYVVIKSGNYPLIEVNLNKLDKNLKEFGTSLALVKGVADYYVKHGYKVGGFVATMTSTVGRGSGVSSSASFECCVAEIFNVLYNDGVIDPVTKAKASQYAESSYFGKPCGLLDQSAIALGGVAYIDFADPANPQVDKLAWSVSDSVILVNTGGDHTRLTDCYAAITNEMGAVARLLGGEVLNGLDPTELAVKVKQAGLSGRAALRAIHFFSENARVEQARKALKEGDVASLRDALSKSGYSSLTHLQNLYVPGDDKQPIPLALEIAQELGATAARVHGGGFAGTILTTWAHEDKQAAKERLQAIFGQDNVFAVSIRPDGAIGLDLSI